MNLKRYQRQIVLPEIGLEGQEKLLRARVLVVGAGGLGVPVLQYLVGMGVGHISVLDGDVVSMSNLQRQVIYRTNDIGKPKVDIAKHSLDGLNPDVEIKAYFENLTDQNASELIARHDVIVDCTDNLEVRYLIDDQCREHGKPFVYGALYKYEGQVSVFNYLGTPGYRQLFPDDQAKAVNCAEIGVLGALPGIIGSFQAIEVVKTITGFGESLAGKLMVIDAAANESYVIKLAEQVKQKQKANSDLISWKELDSLNESEFHLIDIRTPILYDNYHDDRFANIPINELEGFQPTKDKLILVCEQGISTRNVSLELKSRFPYLRIYQVKGGYQSK